MKYALLFGEKILPEKGMKAECPCCMKEVLSKCGQVNEWHWAHVQKEGCDYFERSETEWHRFHKSKFSKESNEVRFISKSGEIHIADVFNEDTVFEFQHSSISYGVGILGKDSLE
jgi:competence CoiA-like predicted nuclease